MKLLSLFSGIGAFEKALDRCKIKYELGNYCEIDQYASKAYALIHGVDESMNLGDITKVDTATLQNIDMVTYGFPCQDLSNAGKQRGFEDENGNRTRSGLFFEALRIIEDTKPKFAICENVKALTSKKFEKEFAMVLQSLDEVGYNNYWQVLNAKDYGVPQNRERIFIISIRKDIDHGFIFPETFRLEVRLKDVLEKNVDKKYYLDDEKNKRLIMSLNNDCSVVHVKEATRQGYAEATEGDSVNLQFPDSKTRRGRVGKQVSQTLQCNDGMGVVVSEPMCAASRGRNPENPSDRTAGAPTVQRLEINRDGVTNALTTVQKDNYIIEPVTESKKKKVIRGFTRG